MILRLLLSLTLLFPLSAVANERYETLLTDLAQSKTSAEADALSSEIWEIWLTAPDEAAQSVLDAAMISRMSQDFLGAIRHLNRLVDGWPEYAEGWNQRATLFFILGDYDASLADVAETLAREPRHFGALSGKAVILMRQGKVGLAQLTVQEALKFHPHLNERALLDINPGEDL